MNWDAEARPVSIPHFRGSSGFRHPLSSMLKSYGWDRLPTGVPLAIFNNAKSYFASFSDEDKTKHFEDISVIALKELLSKLPPNERAQVSPLPPIWRTSWEAFDRNNVPPSLRSEEALAEFALQHSNLHSVIPSEVRFAMFTALISENHYRSYCGTFEKTITYSEWKTSVGAEVHKIIDGMRVRSETLFSADLEDYSSIMPLFGSQAEIDAYKALYTQQMKAQFLAQVDAIAAEVSILDGGMDRLSKSGMMRENRYNLDSKITIKMPYKSWGNIVEYTFKIRVEDIGGGVKAIEHAKFTPFYLFLLAVPIVIISAVIQANFKPGGTFGDIVMFSGGIASAYILLCIFICVIKS